MGKGTRAPAVRERPGSMIVLGTDCTCVPLALRFLVHIHIIILLHVLVVVLFIYKYICRLEGYYFFSFIPLTGLCAAAQQSTASSKVCAN